MTTVALAHDWLTGMRGGEKVLEVLCELFPAAPIYTLVHRRGSVSPLIEAHTITTSFIQRLPAAERHYRTYLPIFPLAVDRLHVAPVDVVISSSHCAIKAIAAPPGATHLCYCHSPMRYAWDQFDAYFGPARVGRLRSRWLYQPVLERLARWDAATSARVHRFVANSRHVAGRIRRYYNRDAAVVPPPVDTDFYHPAAATPGSHLLIVSALVPYKKLDLAIEACRRLQVALRIIGDGPERTRLEEQAGDAKVTFLGSVSNERIREEYRQARAVLLPGEEDFGIVPVEAQACGTPVVALGRGGALETVIDGVTGVLYGDVTVESLMAGITRADRLPFDRGVLREHALQFSRERHRAALQDIIEETMAAPHGTRW